MTAKSPASDALDRASVFLATGLGLTFVHLKFFRLLPIVKDRMTDKGSGCGLVGSTLGLLTYILLPASLASSPLLLVLGVLAAVIVSARAEKVLGTHDDTRIVIDEWIGCWIAATAVPQNSLLGLAAAFFLFRVFDVWKGPFASLQRLPGGWGVTMDDVAAGLVSAFILYLIPVI